MAQPKDALVTGEWECAECGYVAEGSEFQRPAQCPECNAGPEAFQFTSYEEDDEWDSDVDDDDEDLDDDFDDDFDEDEDDFDEDEDDDDFDDDFDEFEDEYDDER